MESELVRRYTYAVTQKLPEAQRADIAKELQGLIEDMLEDRVQGRPATEKDVEAVLLELGSPDALADKYRGRKLSLIGPETFPTYWMVLKIVLAAVGLAMFVVFVIETVSTPAQIVDHFTHFLGSIWMACLQAFAWVTITFAILERVGMRRASHQDGKEHEWKPSDLPALPEEAYPIKPAEPIVGIVFTMLFVVLLTSAVSFFGVWISQERNLATIIPFFNEAVFRSYLPFIWGFAALSVLGEALKLVTGKWTLPLVAFDTLVNICSFAVAMVIFSNPAIWNPNFIQQLVQAGFVQAGSSAYQSISTLWQQATQEIVYLIGLIFAIQMISTAVRVYRMLSLRWRESATRTSI